MKFIVAAVVFVRGGVWLIEDLVNCLLPIDIPQPIKYWTDGNP